MYPPSHQRVIEQIEKLSMVSTFAEDNLTDELLELLKLEQDINNRITEDGKIAQTDTGSTQTKTTKNLENKLEELVLQLEKIATAQKDLIEKLKKLECDTSDLLSQIKTPNDNNN